MNVRFNVQKNRCFALILLVIFLSVSCFGIQTTNAQVVGKTSTGQPVYNGTIVANTSGQGAAYTNGQTHNASASSTNQSSAPGSIGSCVGSIASSYVTSYVSSFIGGVADQLHVRTQSQNDFSVTGASVNGAKLPSWNSVGWCVINGIIAYVGQSLVQWINTGFNGNPAFISNPQQFFGDIANIEAGTLINQIAHNTTGLNLCQPLRLQISTGLANQYGGNRPSALTCSLDQLGTNLSSANNYQVFVNNSGGYGGNLPNNNVNFYKNWQAVALNPQNNQLGATLIAQQQMQASIAQQQNTANINLNWSHGILPIQNCPPASAVSNSSGGTTQVSKPCQTTTPGNIIENKINNTLNNGNQRLVIAQTFDQIVSALIGQLVSVGLSHVLSK